ncbi:MAG: hypothetical protein WA715_14470 [Candidatus Acidiferrum sp.]
MTKTEIRVASEHFVTELKSISKADPDTARPSLDFKRDWAYGNAGLEDERITREQVGRTIQD